MRRRLRCVVIAVGSTVARHVSEARLLLNRGWAILTAVALATSAACSESEPSMRAGDLLRFRVDGERVNSDSRVAKYFSGDSHPANEALFDAACHNVTDWLNDMTLNNSIAVNQSDRYIRMAELVATGEVSRDLVIELEWQAWLGAEPWLDETLRQAGFTAEDVANYVRAVAEPPSPEAKDRYVVYAVSRNVDLLEIVAFDTTEHVDEDFARRATMTVHLFDAQGSQTEVSIPDEACQT